MKHLGLTFLLTTLLITSELMALECRVFVEKFEERCQEEYSAIFDLTAISNEAPIEQGSTVSYSVNGGSGIPHRNQMRRAVYISGTLGIGEANDIEIALTVGDTTTTCEITEIEEISCESGLKLAAEGRSFDGTQWIPVEYIPD